MGYRFVTSCRFVTTGASASVARTRTPQRQQRQRYYQPRFESVFLRRRGSPHGTSKTSTPTPPPSRPTAAGSSGRAGAGLQAKVMRWASSSSFRGRLGWGRSCNTPANPSSAKRRLMRNTVPSETSNAPATLGALHPTLVLSRIRALAVTGPDFSQREPNARAVPVPPAPAAPRTFP